MITLMVSSREKNRKNPGNLVNFLSSIRKSIYSPDNLEIIFKFDDDDDLIEDQLKLACSYNPDLNVKYLFSERYGYLGLHKAYYDIIPHASSESYIFVPMADDFNFIENSHWDQNLLQKSSHLKNEPFIVQDEHNIGNMHDAPFFSKKLVELTTLGNSLSVDSLLMDFCNIYLELKLNDYIVLLPNFNKRIMCQFDWSHERWNVEREELMSYLASQEYKDYLSDCKKKIKKYFKL